MTNPAKPSTQHESASLNAPTSINPDEIAKFTAMADTWWDVNGPFRPLHKFNPVRIEILKKRFAKHFNRSLSGERPFEGLRLLDVGCGGGLISEPMAKLGFDVTGVDASEKNVAIAQNHAERMGLPIQYKATSPEKLTQDTASFDAVLSLEVVEHVADLDFFMKAAAAPLCSGGFMGLATLNRTLKSLALAKVGAEYILRWLPIGTHNWSDFVKPYELEKHIINAGLNSAEYIGLSFNPLTDTWSETTDLAVNYMAFTTKP